MGKPANFEIVHKDDSGYLTIADLGPWDVHLSVTNDAENVIERLFRSGDLQPGNRLFYYDTDGDLSELLIDVNGRFAGFAIAKEQ